MVRHKDVLEGAAKSAAEEPYTWASAAAAGSVMEASAMSVRSHVTVPVGTET